MAAQSTSRIGASPGVRILLAAWAAASACVPFDAPGDPAFDARIDAAIGPGNGTIEQRAFRPKPDEPVDPADPRSTGAGPQDGPGSPEAAAGGPTPLSVALLRQQVLEDNLGLQVLRLDPEIARAKLDAERAKFDATFVARVGFSDEDKPLGDSTLYGVKSPDTPGFDGVFTELEQNRQKTTGSVGLVQPLPTGGRLGVEQNFTIDDKVAGPIRSSTDRSALSFSFSQPLLRGAGIRVNTASIRLAELGRASVSLKTKLAAIRLMANAEKAYWQAYAAQKKLEVRQDQFAIATDLQEFVRERIEAGVEPAIDQVAADLAVAQQRENLVLAETAVRIRQRELRRILNRPLEGGVSFVLETEPSLVAYDLSSEFLVAQALANRMELLEVEVRLAADLLRIDLAENATLPVFALDFSYGIGQRGASAGSAFVDQFDFESQGFAVGVYGSIPVTNARARARLREAMFVRKQRLRTRALRELAIRQEVLDTRDVMDQNWQRILAARQNVLASARNLQAERDQLAIGTQTTQDLAIALNLLGSAQTREIDAIVDYQVAQIDLAYATGTLLGYAGARLDPLPIGVDQE